MALKLLAETFASEDQFEYIVEEKNSREASTMWITGPYLGAEIVNKNKRIYGSDEVAREVNRFTNEMVKTGRAMGELNHPASAEVNPERACHLITELRRDGNIFYGKSKVLSTPLGGLVRSLINDGVKVGMSSRALGKLIEENTGVSRVTDMRLITVDCVADPSYTKAFVNGILESKQFVVNADGTLEESYDRFEESLRSLPKTDVESYLKQQIMLFLESLKNK